MRIKSPVANCWACHSYRRLFEIVFVNTLKDFCVTCFVLRLRENMQMMIRMLISHVKKSSHDEQYRNATTIILEVLNALISSAFICRSGAIYQGLTSEWAGTILARINGGRRARAQPGSPRLMPVDPRNCATRYMRDGDGARIQLPSHRHTWNKLFHYNFSRLLRTNSQ